METKADGGVEVEEDLPVVELVQGVGEDPQEDQERDDDSGNHCNLSPGGQVPIGGGARGTETANNPANTAHSVPLDTGSLLNH